MTRLMTSLLAAGVLAATAAVPAVGQTTDAAPRFAYINSQRIIAEAPGAQEARQAFERDMAEYQRELESLQQEIQTMMEDYEQQQAMLSEDAKRQRQEQILQKQQEYQQRASQLQEQAAQRQSELVEPIMERINAVIDTIRQERGYTMIFDAAAGAVIAADPSLDITQEVLDRLNSTASNNR